MGSDFNSDANLAMPRVLVTEPAIRHERQMRRAAARHVASRAHDPADCAELLGALGLTAEEGHARA